MNFLFGQAKIGNMVITKKKLNGEESTDVVMILIGLIKARVKIEFAYYKLIENIEMFKFKCCINNCICEVTHDVFLNLYVWFLFLFKAVRYVFGLRMLRCFC